MADDQLATQNTTSDDVTVIENQLSDELKIEETNAAAETPAAVVEPSKSINEETITTCEEGATPVEAKDDLAAGAATREAPTEQPAESAPSSSELSSDQQEVTETKQKTESPATVQLDTEAATPVQNFPDVQASSVQEGVMESPSQEPKDAAAAEATPADTAAKETESTDEVEQKKSKTPKFGDKKFNFCKTS